MDKVQTTYQTPAGCVKLTDYSHFSRFLEVDIANSTFTAVLERYMLEHPGAWKIVNDDGSSVRSTG